MKKERTLEEINNQAMSWGEDVERMKREEMDYYNKLEAIESGQKKFRKVSTNIFPKKKKRKK